MKERRIIFIQIQTGKLLPLGMIDDKSVEWQALPVDLKMELLVSVGYQYGPIFLPDLKLPTKHVLTGCNLFQKRKNFCNSL